MDHAIEEGKKKLLTSRLDGYEHKGDSVRGATIHHTLMPPADCESQKENLQHRTKGAIHLLHTSSPYLLLFLFSNPTATIILVFVFARCEAQRVYGRGLSVRMSWCVFVCLVLSVSMTRSGWTTRQ